MDHLHFLLRLVAASIMRKEHRFLHLEIEILRAQVRYYQQRYPAERRTFSAAWKRRFASLGAELGWKRLKNVMMVASVKTVQRWHALMKRGLLSKPAAKVGRPRADADIEKLVVRLATENPEWGYLRIKGELTKLNIKIGRTTIADILARHGITPIDPQRQTRESTWKQFLTMKMPHLAATDFFTVDVWSWLGWRIGKRTIYVLFAIHLSSRKVEILGMTEHPVEAFMKQVARNATMDEVGWMKQMKVQYLIHDRDSKFSEAFREVLKSGGVESVPTPPLSPNLNAYAERWVRTVKYECLKKLIILGEGGLRRALREFLEHYHQHRPHQSLRNRPPQPDDRMRNATISNGRIRRSDSCEGILRHYYRSAA